MAYKYDRKNRNIRLTDAEWEDFKTLMGAEWLRKRIASYSRRARLRAGK